MGFRGRAEFQYARRRGNSVKNNRRIFVRAKWTQVVKQGGTAGVQLLSRQIVGIRAFLLLNSFPYKNARKIGKGEKKHEQQKRNTLQNLS